MNLGKIKKLGIHFAIALCLGTILFGMGQLEFGTDSSGSSQGIFSAQSALADTLAVDPTTFPAPGAIDVNTVGLVIEAIFDQPITFSDITLKHNGGFGNISGIKGPQNTATATFTPTDPMPANTLFTVAILDIQVSGQPFAGIDCDNDPINDTDDFCWTFTSAPQFTPTMSFYSTFYQVAENAGQVSIVVSLDAPFSQSVSATFVTSDGTATDTEDYVGVSQSVVFGPNETMKTVNVPIVDSGAVEPTEQFQAQLQNINNALAGYTTTTVEITDNDIPLITLSPPTLDVAENVGNLTFAIQLDKPSFQAVTVDYNTINGTAVFPTDFHPQSGTLVVPAGQTSANFAMTIVDDFVVEASPKTFQLTLANPQNGLLGSQILSTLSIQDDDVGVLFVSTDPVDQATSVSVLRSDVTISFSKPVTTSSMFIAFNGGNDLVPGNLVGNGTSQLGFQRTGSSFPANTTFRVFVLDIIDLQGNPLVGLDCDGNGVAHDYCWTFTTFLPELAFELSQYTVNESSGQVDVAVRINGSSETAVTVDVATQNGSALHPADYLPVSQTLTFTPGELVQTIPINIVDDLDIEGTESFSVTLANVANGTLVSPQQATVFIQSDDAIDPLRVTLTPTQSQIYPGGSVDFVAAISGGTSPYSVAWDFGDGMSATGTDSSISHTYAASGMYNLVVNITDSQGTVVSAVAVVDVIFPPIARFEADQPLSFTDLAVQLNNISTGVGLQHSWNFGDGSSSTEASPTHTFINEGTFLVTLTVTNGAGQSVYQRNIQVHRRTIPMSSLVLNTSVVSWSNAATDSTFFEVTGVLQMPPSHRVTVLQGPIQIAIAVEDQFATDGFTLTLRNNQAFHVEAYEDTVSGVVIREAVIFWQPNGVGEFLLSGQLSLPPASVNTRPPKITYAIIAPVIQGGVSDIIGDVRTVTYTIQGDRWQFPN